MAALKKTLGLAQMRVRNGVTLSEIAEKTKISKYFLQAIEDEQFSKLPGGVFSRSYIRQYAEAVGIGDGTLLETYSDWLAANSDAPRPKQPAPRGWLSSMLASVLS